MLPYIFYLSSLCQLNTYGANKTSQILKSPGSGGVGSLLGLSNCCTAWSYKLSNTLSVYISTKDSFTQDINSWMSAAVEPNQSWIVVKFVRPFSLLLCNAKCTLAASKLCTKLAAKD